MENQEVVETQDSSAQTNLELRNELKALSLELFGSSSRWQKLRNQKLPITRSVTLEDGTVTEESVRLGNKVVRKEVQMTDLAILGMLKTLLQAREDNIKRLAEEKAKKEAAEAVKESVSGTAK
jgi:hypothetical protein